MFKKDDWKTGILALSIGLCMLLFSLPLNGRVQQAQRLSELMGPSGLPNIIAGIMIFIGLLHLGMSYRLRKQDSPPVTTGEECTGQEKGKKSVQDWVLYLVVAISLGYIVLLPRLGYLLMTMLLMTVLMYLFNEQKWQKVLIISVVFSGFLYFVFSELLGVLLPVLFG
ncbi:MAG: tripartite tricarboxylate transporter TctB family protein [Dehalobacterium sp.]